MKRVPTSQKELEYIASYLLTHISYLEKTYTTTAQEPSIYAIVLLLVKYY